MAHGSCLYVAKMVKEKQIIVVVNEKPFGLKKS